jgi:diamine N-acetyltransferase
MNNSPFFIYEIDASHLEDLVKIAVRTFGETFAATNSEENMKQYYARCFTAEQLGEEMKNPQSWFFFAEHNGRLAGYLKVNSGKAQTELKEPEGFEVERIYVLRKFQGTGVGGALMNYAITLGKKQGCKYLWLGVHEENHRALRFYKKFGLKTFGDHVFMMGMQPQRDLLMRLEL